MAEGYHCPVCAKQARLYDVVDFNRSCEEDNGTFLPLSGEPVYYALCPHCGFLFAPQFLDWTQQQFLDRIYNADYAVVDPEFADKRPRQTASMLEEMFGQHKSRIRHLDYGGGDGRLSRLLNENGWTSTSWDPFFEPDSTLDGQTFDLITAVEVFEHAPHPHKMLEQLLSAAHDNSFIVFSTFVHDKSIMANGRINWWYVAPRNGHVSIFSSYSLGVLGQAHGLNHGGFTDYLHCYCKTVPDWARHLID